MDGIELLQTFLCRHFAFFIAFSLFGSTHMDGWFTFLYGLVVCATLFITIVKVLPSEQTLTLC